ncbi:hypothetical protein [Roseiconus lacunae]|uniref:hypothetical protein n=1 Tax=Roseiconus lacunae TaxID=2605694 RepID=UPI001E3F6BAD|nr:hypothetical protein [Roseiconus lacunae]MCD0458142.1 hypothetical protein [Roseiconus lacunae]
MIERALVDPETANSGESPSGQKPSIAFLNGLADKGGLSVLGSLSVTVAWLAFLCIAVTPETIRTLEWEQTKGDAYGSLTSRVAQAATASREGQLRVGLISASSFRDSISDSRLLSDAIEDSWGQPVEFVNLTAGALTLWETATIADVIANQFEGLILIEVSPNKFCRDADELREITTNPRLGFRSSIVSQDRKLRQVDGPDIIGVYTIDNLAFLLSRRYKLLARVGTVGEPPSLVLKNQHSKLFSVEFMHRRVRALKRDYLRKYFDEVDSNISLLERAVSRLTETGKTRVLLVEAPFNPLAAQLLDTDPAYREVMLDYDLRISRLAERCGIAYWAPGVQADFACFDFTDDFHIGDFKARVKFTSQLARRIKDIQR